MTDKRSAMPLPHVFCQANIAPQRCNTIKQKSNLTVVPIFTEATCVDGIAAFFMTASIASSTPFWISEVVGVLCQARTFSSWRMTLQMGLDSFLVRRKCVSTHLSVFVPPTSMPITQDGSCVDVTGSMQIGPLSAFRTVNGDISTHRKRNKRKEDGKNRIDYKQHPTGIIRWGVERGN
jgi:hypothetical protein